VSARPFLAGAALIAASLAAATGCGRRVTARVPVAPPPAPLGWSETGVASWYGIPYDGRRAASGEIFDMHALTAAHRTLPFDTWLEVTNLQNGKRVTVRINDRGPFVDGRIIDLAMGAAEEIDMVRAGLAKVRLKVIKPPPVSPAPAGGVSNSNALQ
jgi:rare lipoprotein A